MNTIKAFLILSLGIILFTTDINAQSVAIDATKAELDKLIASTEAIDKKLLADKLLKLSASSQEKDMDLAINYYYQLKNQKASDSLVTEELKKFPIGSRARSKEATDSIYSQKTGLAKENAYKKWMFKFPTSKFVDDLLIYDYVANAIATDYANEKNTKKAIEYINKLQVDFWKGNGYSALAASFYKTGDLKNAAIYYKKAVESAKEYYDGKLSYENSSKFAASGFIGLSYTYANILYKQKNYKEALKYAAFIIKDQTTASASANLQYVDILMSLNKYEEAYKRLEQSVKDGKANNDMIETFKEVYVKVKGSDAGLEKYAAEISASIIASLKEKLNKEMFKKPAVDFTLNDLDGKEVSLSSLKGKVVVLDFWATWCAPCKASFPAMQMAVNKYKEDPNVIFLFIHTWEKSPSPKKDADDYIKSEKYTFEVLMDIMDPETKINKVVSDYKVKGIPSKFVIDPAGNVRFNLIGFEGSNDTAVDEISIMIEMAKKN